MPEPVIWALVLNAASARILRGIQRDGHCSEPPIDLQDGHHHLRDLMSDKPGRSFASVGMRRSAMEYASDPVRDAERAFVRQILDQLDAARAKGSFDRLAVFASRPMLGLFRQDAPPELARLVIREVTKNYLHLSPDALNRTVARALFHRPDTAELA